MKRKLFAAAALASIFAGTAVYAQSNYTDADLVWSDEFNSGKTINEKFWSYEPHEPGWVNNELQSYGKSTENTYVKDGCLVIQPIRTENKDGSYSYTSGRINTLGKKSFRYGRIEARIKFPKGQGFLPAFWMMPVEESYYGSWPKCGEIDIAEVLGNKPETLYGTIHYGDPHSESQGSYTLTDGDFNSDFHQFAVEWEPGEIRYYCDGNLYKTMNNWFTKKLGFGEVTYPAPFDQDFYIILNVAVGGNWPGNPTDETEFGETARMLVDWVKVYQKKSYNEDVIKPAPEKIVLNADSTGNLVKPDSASWNFLTAGNGKGALKVNNGELTITTSESGSLEYSVQVVQSKMPMEAGKTYRYSFDAWADEERTIITGITAPDASYMRMFGDLKIKLSTKKQHFEYDFNQLDLTDPNCRIEYNLGAQNSTATVHITNIRLEQTGDVDYSKLNAGILPDGNYIQNGLFQEGTGRMAHWEVRNQNGAKVSVTNEKSRELKIENPKKTQMNQLQVVQSGLKLPKGKDFVVRFNAHSTKSCRIEVTIGKEKFVPLLMAGDTKFEFLFKTEDYGEEGTSLVFNAGIGGAVIFIDNVSVKENVCLLNGDFDNGMAGFEVYSHDSVSQSNQIEAVDGNNQFQITVEDTGKQDWMLQLKQNNILLEKGKKYKVSLKAKCDMDRTIMYALQRDGSKDDNWDPYSGTIKFNVNNNWQTFGNTFVMGKDTDENVIFTISMGAVNDKQIKTKHTIYIDSIVVEQVAE